MNLWNLPNSKKDALDFFQEKGLLPKHREYIGKNEIFWKCNVKTCQHKTNMRVGNWFENSRLSFLTILRLIYCWSAELTSFVDWNNYTREVCTITISRNQQMQIEGPGKIVEIDESMFSKRKNNAGRILPQQWIIGGFCRETKEIFLIQVPNRTTETLSFVIKQYIKVGTGTTIYSDCWRGYDTDELTRAKYTHSTVNHSNNFVDPRIRRHHLESYLAEFIKGLTYQIWRRQNIEGEPFDNIMKNISENWSPKTEF
ncbi:hypothetical protein AGLY_010024 [Aphis glycines]|uniref:ISXO2-like transposase domain-containing protein n=1 Tax=Aphis glycines TaxID=307491 RepID=A0A6G0TG98_APHGL|nr:hypothetical protein AGLY_010024 [Aphis glycines]